MITTVSLQGFNPQRHTVQGVSPKHVAELIAVATGQEAIWTGKVTDEWHVTDRRTRKVGAIVYCFDKKAV